MTDEETPEERRAFERQSCGWPKGRFPRGRVPIFIRTGVEKRVIESLAQKAKPSSEEILKRGEELIEQYGREIPENEIEAFATEYLGYKPGYVSRLEKLKVKNPLEEARYQIQCVLANIRTNLRQQ